jgi:GrpB-like predicted nucleotidyltransferase (UPF0157 family)
LKTKPDSCSSPNDSVHLQNDTSDHFNLGLKRDSVRLVCHNPDWGVEFGITSQDLIRLMGEDLLAVHHIGSTAIPRIPAKPILDVAAVIKGFDTLEKYLEILETQGYYHRPIHDKPDRWLVVRGDLTSRTHHIHFFRYDSPSLQEHLFFRDFLLSHPDTAAQYARLKMYLASHYSTDRARYTHEKASFIREVLTHTLSEIPDRDGSISSLLPSSHMKQKGSLPAINDDLCLNPD